MSEQHCKICHAPLTRNGCKCPATPGQQRAIRYHYRKSPDTVRALLHGVTIEALTKGHASEVIGALKGEQPPAPTPVPDPVKDWSKDTEEAGWHEEEESPDEQKQPTPDAGSYKPRAGTVQAAMAEIFLRNGLSKDKHADVGALMTEIRESVGNSEPFVFEANVGGGRAPLPLGFPADDTQQTTQFGRARKTAYAVRRDLVRYGASEAGQKKEPKREQKAPEQPKQPEQPQPKGDTIPREAMAWLERWQKQIRPYVRERGIAEASMRATIKGALNYLSGIPFAATEYAVAMDWPQEARTALGIRPFDPTSLPALPDAKRDENGRPARLTVPKIDSGDHALTAYVERLISAGIDPALIGPAGCGKSYLPAKLAERYGIPFGFLPLTQGASTSWFTGAYTLDGFKTRPFLEIWKNGGIFLLDEMDAADANLLLMLNNAIANGIFENPADGKSYERHADTILFAAMNTMGTGANKRYTGRERLDLATLDRWAIGRVEMDYDTGLERKIFQGIFQHYAA